jgi:hypothetical protein
MRADEPFCPYSCDTEFRYVSLYMKGSQGLDVKGEIDLKRSLYVVMPVVT